MLTALMISLHTRLFASTERGCLEGSTSCFPRRAATAEGRLYVRVGICISEGANGRKTPRDLAARAQAGASHGRGGRAVRWRYVGGVRGSVYGGQLVRNQRRRAAIAFDHRYGVALPDDPAPDHRRVLPGLVGKRQATTRL